MPGINDDMRAMIDKYGWDECVAALARCFYSPWSQPYGVKTMQTAFRRLNAVYEYLKSQR